MSGLQRVLMAAALLLMPALAWTFSLWRENVARLNVVEAQKAEMRETRALFQQLVQEQHDIALGQPFRFPFAYQLVDRLPPVGAGQPALVWVGSVAPHCWEDGAWQSWGALWADCPRLLLVAVLPDVTTGRAQELTSAAADEPRFFRIASADPGLIEHLGPPGTFLLVDARGILRQQGRFEGCSPLEEERRPIVEWVRGGETP